MKRQTFRQRMPSRSGRARGAPMRSLPADKEELEHKKERVRTMKRALDGPKLIGTEEELIPFSWRHPLAAPDDHRKMNKVYRDVISLERSLTYRDSDKL